MSIAGLVDGVRTNDPDTLVFGGTQMLKPIFRKGGKYEIFTREDCLKQHGLTQFEFVQTAIAMGTDFAPKVPRVGAKTVIKKIKEKKINWTEEQAEAMGVFIEKPLTKFDIPKKDKFKMTTTSVKKLIEWLVVKQGFKRDRLEKQMEPVLAMITKN